MKRKCLYQYQNFIFAYVCTVLFSFGVLFLFKHNHHSFWLSQESLSPSLSLSLSLSLSHKHTQTHAFVLNMMRGLSLRSLTFMLFIAFLLWSSNFETCNARRGKHWRHSSGTSASLYKKKGKSRGSSNNHHSGGSKPKSPPHKASPLPTPKPKAPPLPTPKRKAPPLPSPKPKEEFPSNPPAGHSTTFNVLDFGAKGDGRTDDTKVIPNSHQMLKKICLMLLCNIYGLHANIRKFFFFQIITKFSILQENSGEWQNYHWKKKK